MQIKDLAEALRTIALRAGTMTDADFEGVPPLDIVTAYAMRLSDGRIYDPQDIRAYASGAPDAAAYIERVSRPTINVPTQDQCRSVLAGTLDVYEPPEAAPDKRELVIAHLRKLLRAGVRETWKFMMDSEAPRSEIDSVDKLTPDRVLREFLNDNATGFWKIADGVSVARLIEDSVSPEDFVKTVTNPENF